MVMVTIMHAGDSFIGGGTRGGVVAFKIVFSLL
jgi:hypothetical protein